ncbi:hypothetical protein Y032_0468g1998, partial [Ancylostoma ceylanicum]
PQRCRVTSCLDLLLLHPWSVLGGIDACDHHHPSSVDFIATAPREWHAQNDPRKPIKASDLRENLEILQANGGRSPRTSELIQDQSDVMTVTAREPAVHPGPPQKEMSTGSRGSLGSRDSFSEVGKNETNTEKDKKSSEKDAAVNEAVAERRKRTKKSTNASNTKTTENVKKEETVPLMSPKRPSKSSTNEGNLPYKGLKSRKSSGKKMFSIWPFKKRKQ